MRNILDMLAAARPYVFTASCNVGSKAGPIVAEIDEYLQRAQPKYPWHAVKEAGEVLQALCHAASTSAGWWNDLETGAPMIERPHIVGEKLMLIVSEVAEAMEGHRKNLNDDKLPHRPMIEVELADALIRIADLAGALGLDLGGAVAEKLEYNSNRPDHKPENRKLTNGKKY